MKKRRTARLDEFGYEECDAFRDAIQNRVKEASSFSGLVLEPSPDINDCNLPDQANFYLSFQLPVPGSDEELDVEASVTHNPYMSLQFYLRVGEDEEEEYEVDLENGNQEAMMDVIGDAFNKGWSDRTGAEVIWEALKPFFPADGVPAAHFSSYGTETSSPMFSTTGEGELEFEISDEIAEDDYMMDLVDMAYEMASNKGRTPINWEEMADYVENIYYEHGGSPELAKPADWDLVARSVHERIMEKPSQKTGEVHPLDDEDFPQPNDGYITDTGQSSWNFDLKVYKKKLGGPYRSLNEATQAFEQWAEKNQSFMALWFVDDGGGMNSVDYDISSGRHKEGLATESPFPPPPKRRLMQREEGGYKSKKKLKEFLYKNGDPSVGWSDETYGRDSMIYIQWGSPTERKEWEEKLEDAGFKVNRRYWPGSSTSEIQVSYFKGTHWDE